MTALKDKKHIISISRRITLAIALSVFIVAFFGIVLVYFFGHNLLISMLGSEYSQIAAALGEDVVKSFNDEIEDAKSYATRRLWRDAVAQSNLKYAKMGEEEIKSHMAAMDKKWIFAEKDSAFLAEYLNSNISLGMRAAVQVRGAIAELFVTDKYGGIVASSNKTSDFYQADEGWWQAAYNGGKGDIYAGDIEFDDSTGRWIIPIAVPILDENKVVVGVVKYSILINRLFAGLFNLSIGDTGHVILIDGKGRILFHHGIDMIKEHLPMDKGLGLLLSSSKTYGTVSDKYFHDKKIFIAFNKANPPYLCDRGIRWIALVVQDDAEVLKPINRFMIGIIIIAFLMLILAVPVGSIFGGRVAKPIHELYITAERIIDGDWDHAMDINTGDEIEEFANIFSRMVTDIRNKQKELEEFSKGLESKVAERTKELMQAQEASLNILEDLQASKEELEKANKELKKLDELKSEFISTVSHELRTPLSIIKEGISLVLDKIPGDVNEKQTKILDISKYNIDRLARIIDSLLDISKIEAGKVEMNKDLITISDVVNQVAASFNGKIKEKGLVMRLDIDKVEGKIYADTDRITQVLTNLIGNAVKFTSSGHIDISCKEKEDSVVCSIADTGMGIAKDDLPKMFNKFQQFGRTAGAGEKGTGLGLAIAKNIIDMHNGAIWVESEIGKGTKFTFKLHKYTPQSLFTEYVSRAVEKTANESSGMSVIAIDIRVIGKDETGSAQKRLHNVAREMASLIKSALRREGDDVVNSGLDMMVILADCGKDNSVKIQNRLESMVNKYLDGQELNGIIKVDYGCATYPDDAKNALELIEKAKSALAVSAKA